MKKYLLLIFISVLFVGLSEYSYVTATASNLSSNVFRLHVIANSDSNEDQDLKYKVRDSLINYMKKITSNITTKEEAIKIVKEHIADFENIAQTVVFENGFNYAVNIEIGKFDFPTKTYGDVSFPSGYYDALRVKIGEAEGQNWWCVMFPPLCFVDVTSGIIPEESKENLEENLDSESYNLISNNEDDIGLNIKFKLIELFQNIGTKLAKE